MTNLEKQRDTLENLLTRRFFYAPSFSIYGGVKGLYDYGPYGCSLKHNLIDLWRRHFILEEGILEIDTPAVTPGMVLKTSGHVDRFTDLMVRDEKTGDCYRADHLLKDYLDSRGTDTNSETQALRARIDDLNAEEIGALIEKYAILAPVTSNKLTKPFPFNLMFSTSIGPNANLPGYLRPETAQGIFVNFPKLLEMNFNRLPFAAATIGTAFRNEIAPRSGLLRVREFTMAEIEHFVDPENKKHAKFNRVKDVLLRLYSRECQNNNTEPITMCLQDAVQQKIINNETLGYFLARTCLFLEKVGIPKEALRFRQHLANEMAHYATDCWDAEIKTSYGWIECVGHADRSCYDLTRHAEATGARMAVFEPYEVHQTVIQRKIIPNKGVIGKKYRENAQKVIAAIEKLTNIPNGPIEVQIDNTAIQLETSMYTIIEDEVKITGRTYTPAVIEPSFGIGRIIYAILEHAFAVRPDDAQKTYLRLTAEMAPIKCVVLPHLHKEEMTTTAEEIAQALTKAGISNKIDASSTLIGRRYSRYDEIGVPYAITVDLGTFNDSTVTIRERESREQVRVPVAQVPTILKNLMSGLYQWRTAEEWSTRCESC